MRIYSFLILLLIISCSHRKNISPLKGSYFENLDELDLSQSFAFIHRGSDYYFSRKLQEESGQDCAYIVGFKDGKPEYQFTAQKLVALNEIYEAKISLEERMELALTRMNEYKKLPLQGECSKPSSFAESFATLIVYSPLIIFTTPLWAVPVIDEALTDTRWKKLRLKMSFEDTRKLLGNKPFEVRKEGEKTFYFLDNRQQRLVMFFQNDSLVAWVRGIRNSRSSEY